MSKKNGWLTEFLKHVVPSNLEFHVIDFTPERCRWLLDESAVTNRVYNEVNLAAMIELMRLRQFPVNGVPIVLTDRPDILDGHHRLYAGATSGCGFQSACVVGVGLDLMDTFDAGSRRTLADYICITTPNLKKIAKLGEATFNQILRYAFSANVPPLLRSARERLKLFYRDPCVLEAVRAAEGKGQISTITAAMAGAVRYIGRVANPEIADEFVDRLLDGQNLRTGMPVLAVREYFLTAEKYRAPARQMTNLTKYRASLTALAWKLQGRTVTSMRGWKPMDVPGAEPAIIRARLGLPTGEPQADEAKGKTA